MENLEEKMDELKIKNDAEYVLHFDPGTINMAYCLLHIETS